VATELRHEALRHEARAALGCGLHSGDQRPCYFRQ
jgi:hypothetical protein